MPLTTDSPLLAGPPGDCCVKGVKHTGDPVGKTITIADVPTYISEPGSSAGSKKVLLFLADVYGPFFVNAQLLQDYFASNGYTVLGLDYFLGDPIHLHLEDADFDRNAWFAKVKAQAADVFPKWVKAVREQYGTDAKYVAVGYCFGGPYALDLAATDDVVASAFAHPAFLTEDNFRKITKPLLLSCAETDHTFPAESRRRAEDILQEVKATYHLQLFSGVTHGFATRGDPEVENSRWAKEESARSVIRWFNRFSS
ncbi:Alpha/Beta hydrolase protein [Crucibulum laeve]|uniref:Alpha/Beta hydrolase protein n=1 Tax=Crucibulum laeve TaxID=68775 RepID=A0A5C3M041_9AGAR|nr:Alpha/Beta hydrolase protein [Crucibulum laeve]